MALQNTIGYVRLTFNPGWDQQFLNVSWMTYSNTDWRESNPSRAFADIVEMGSHTFPLAINEKQQVDLDEPYEDKDGNLITHEEQDVVIGYLPQSMEQAHLLLMNLSVKGAMFTNYHFEITGVEIDGETQEEVELKKLWSPDLKIPKDDIYQFFDGETWGEYISLQDHASTKELVPNKAVEYWELKKVEK